MVSQFPMCSTVKDSLENSPGDWILQSHTNYWFPKHSSPFTAHGYMESNTPLPHILDNLSHLQIHKENPPHSLPLISASTLANTLCNSTLSM